MSDIYDSARRLLGREPARPKTWYEEMEDKLCAHCPSLTWQQRLIGCLCCFLIGFLLEFGSFFRPYFLPHMVIMPLTVHHRFTRLLMGDPEPFAVMYTVGNLISICSSCFLSGPWAQVKSMFHPTRAIATGVYIFTLFITLIVAFSSIPGQGAILIICIIIQFLSMVYYILSYIPFARQILWQMCGLGGEASGSLV